MGNIVNIRIEQLHPHPLNPRKDLGDLSELADSIRARGVMQNLTVVPGHYLTDAELKHFNALYASDPDEEIREIINKKWVPDEYTVVIGHRRRAAAQIAGLEELPCVISDMDRKEQAATMLLENMQRSDLTIYEQAQGFQVMMDFGETPESIAEKTGLSETTVRHRLNIAKLDGKVLKKIEDDGAFQLSLGDLYELEKIEDVEKRNQILREARSSADITIRVRYAKRDRKRDKNLEEVKKLLDQFGIEQRQQEQYNIYSSRYITVQEINLDQAPPKTIECAKKDLRLYWQLRYGYDVVIFYIDRKKDKERSDAEEYAKERDRKQKEIKTQQMAATQEIGDFVRMVVAGKLPAPPEEKIVPAIWALLRDDMATPDMFKMVFGLTECDRWRQPEGTDLDALDKKIKALPVPMQMLLTLQSIVRAWHIDVTMPNKSMQSFDALMNVLDACEFVFSREEYRKIFDRTSELYMGAN